MMSVLWYVYVCICVCVYIYLSLSIYIYIYIYTRIMQCVKGLEWSKGRGGKKRLPRPRGSRRPPLLYCKYNTIIMTIIINIIIEKAVARKAAQNGSLVTVSSQPLNYCRLASNTNFFTLLLL